MVERPRVPKSGECRGFVWKRRGWDLNPRGATEDSSVFSLCMSQLPFSSLVNGTPSSKRHCLSDMNKDDLRYLKSETKS